jgi:hypothetical protein
LPHSRFWRQQVRQVRNIHGQHWEPCESVGRSLLKQTIRLVIVTKNSTDAGMRAISLKPIFCIVLGDGDRWSVEAEWPDGTIELVETFKAQLEAMNWVRTLSEAWLQERV